MSISEGIGVARVLARAGVLRLENPVTFVQAAIAARRLGGALAGAVAANAVRHGDRTALVDELGPLSHVELHERSDALAGALHARGVAPGGAVGLLCRDSRYFVLGAIATAKLGADLLLLNTAFSGPQAREVLAREGATVLVCDEELDPFVESDADRPRLVVGWGEGEETIDALVAAGHEPPPPPPGPGRTILLTSGTTGTPKGARRPPEAPTSAVAAVLDRIPLRAGRPHAVVAPMFHAWGFAHFGLGVLLGAETIVRRRFDPEATLQLLERHRAESAAMVPVMAQRILELGPEVLARHDTSALRVIALGGSAIPGDLAVRLMDAFGDVVFNAYGSTEVAMVSIATPQDLRADPATAGRPVSNVVVRLLDDEDRDAGAGPGRIFVGSEAAFEGYTNGDTKPSVAGLMATGDVGSFDAAGRLRVEGRDDDMIVSGGENVQPREVEDAIVALDGVREAAVVGVEDAEFGQRLAAFVVRADGSELDGDAIRAAVKARLARFKVPRDVVFLDELPRTSTGKVLKRELRA